MTLVPFATNSRPLVTEDGVGGFTPAVSLSSGGTTTGPLGAAHLATGTVTTSTTAATLVVARPTRRSVRVTNNDAVISVYVGPATVTAGNGFLLPALQTVTLTWVGLVQVIAASGTPVVSYADEYD